MLDQAKLRRQLEVATSIAVLLVSGVVLFSVVRTYIDEHSLGHLPIGLRKGTVIKLPSLIGNAQRTLLIAMNTGCRYCAESVPFYNEIAENCRKTDGQVRVTAVFPNTQDEVRQYAQAENLKLDTIGGVDFAQIQTAVTPTMILVDDDGTVLNFWVGTLAEGDKQSFLKAIQKGELQQ